MMSPITLILDRVFPVIGRIKRATGTTKPSVKENTQEAAQRGRMGKARGENHYRAKLTITDVRQMRALYLLGISQRELASNYDVSRVTVWRVTSGLSWKHVA